MALVQTVDFFPPIVDDPYDFGQIAAANALSDVYAMGGQPLTALNIVGFPVDKMAPEILIEILRGGNDKIEEAGAIVVGGHSVKDQELKYGVAVTGIVHPDKIISNAGAKTGDCLFLTKPLGTGLITTGLKREQATAAMVKLAIGVMAKLNREASELMIKANAHAATDITGFGLLGHAYEMADGSNVTIRIDSTALPLIDGALEMAEKGMIPGGANANRAYLKDKVEIGQSVEQNIEHVLFDPQTSGGLLVAVSEADAAEFSSALEAASLCHRVIGQVVDKSKYSLIVT